MFTIPLYKVFWREKTCTIEIGQGIGQQLVKDVVISLNSLLVGNTRFLKQIWKMEGYNQN